MQYSFSANDGAALLNCSLDTDMEEVTLSLQEPSGLPISMVMERHELQFLITALIDLDIALKRTMENN